MNLSKATYFNLALALGWLIVPLGAAEDKPASGKPLPSAKEILERYAKAIGGKEAFLKHQSQHAVGTMEMPAQQMSGKLDVYAARPNKLLMVVTIKGLGDIATGYDGKVAWMKTALTGPMLLEGKMREEVATQADFDHALHDPKDFKTMEVLGTENFNGEECYKVKLVHRSGMDSTEFFSIKTGLQRGFISKQETPLGVVNATTVVTEYKQFGDLFMPSRTSQKAAGVETIMTLEKMEYDQVEPSKFELPADVKALLEEPVEKTGKKEESPNSILGNNLKSGEKK